MKEEENELMWAQTKMETCTENLFRLYSIF